MKTRRCLVFAGILVVLACGGGGGSDSGGSGGGGGTIGPLLSYEERTKELTAVAAAVQSIPTTNGANRDPIALVNTIKGVPGLKHVQADEDGTVTGLLADGVPFTIFNTEKTSNLPPVAPQRPSPKKVTDHGTAKLLTAIPAFSLHRQNDDYAMLSANGYDAFSDVATVRILRDLGSSPVGVLYLDSHGGSVVDASGTSMGYGIFTYSNYTKENYAAFQGDLTDRSLGFMYANTVIGGTGAPEWHFAVLPPFITKYHWNLSPDALVMLGACSSGSTAAAAFRQALFTQGASAVTGWTRPVDSGNDYAGTSLLLDKMLGANTVNARTPPERAFDLAAAKALGDSRNITKYVDNGKTVELVIFNRSGDTNPSDILNPSIQRVFYGSANDQAILMGHFGEYPDTSRRQVLFNGSPANVVDWTSGSITCSVPSGGAEVSVEVADREGAKHKSNTRQFSRWAGTISQSITGWNGADVTYARCTINARFFGDIGTNYMEPGGTLQIPGNDWVPGGPSRMNILQAAKGSVANVTIGGSGSDPVTGLQYTFTSNLGSTTIPLSPTGKNRFTMIMGVPTMPGGEGRLRFQIYLTNAMHVHRHDPSGQLPDDDRDVSIIFQTLRYANNTNQDSFVLQLTGGGYDSTGNHDELSMKSTWNLKCSVPPVLDTAR